MTPQEAQNSLGVIGMVGALGLFMPSLDKSWQADPNSSEHRTRLRTGEIVYVSFSVGIGTLAAYAYKSVVPLILCVVFCLTVISMHELALRTYAKEPQ